jgi:hypothetical protein
MSFTDPLPCASVAIVLRKTWKFSFGNPSFSASDADPSLVRQLDCQFQVTQSIHIHETKFYKLTTGDLVKAIQSQINDQLSKLAATGTTLCQTSLTLEVAGNPDAHCFVDAPHDKRVSRTT